MKSSKNKRKGIIIATVSTSLLLISYFAGSFYYKDRFFNDITINETNIGGLNLRQANKKLAKTTQLKEFSIKTDNGTVKTFDTQVVDYQYVDNKDLPNILKAQKEHNWLLAFLKPKQNYKSDVVYKYDVNKVLTQVDSIEEMKNKYTEANLKYDEKSNEFIITPDVSEIGLNEEELSKLIMEALDNNVNEINIENYMLRPKITSNSENIVLAKEKANKLLNKEFTYNYGDRKEVLDSSLFKSWLFFNGQELDVDPNMARAYIVELAERYDTYGRNRNFKASSGQTITIAGGSYGWLTHRGNTVDALIEHLKAGESKTIEPVYSAKALHRETDDIGNSYVEIDLTSQMVYVYINGEMKVQTPTVTGNVAQGHATPRSVDPLNYKTTNTVLKGPGYASPVKYWMPFNGGIGLHDASWRSKFGGQIYKTGGSHGCINLPTEKAKAIYELVYPGMPVIVY